MIYFLKHIKGIVYFLTMLILFQSCVAYTKKTSTIEQASESKNRIKIRTIDGVKHKLKWIEEKDGNVVSIKKAKREYINKNEIAQIVKNDPEPQVISLESPLKQYGAVHILIKDDQGKYESYKFFKIEEQGELIKCYSMTGKDTVAVVIPIDQIEKIQLQDKRESTVLTVLTIIGISTVVVGTIAFVAGGGMNIDIGFSTQ